MADVTKAEATDATPEDVEEEQAEAPEKGQRGEASRDLNRVTDYSEDRDEFDSAKLSKALQHIADVSRKEKEERIRRDVELAKVPINAEDVTLIMTELEVSKAVAEKTLRQHKGNLAETLQFLVDAS